MANAIPADRVPYGGWVRGSTVGVIGGITLRTSVYDDDGFGVTNLLKSIANDDSVDVYAEITAAIAACGANQAVVLPDGIFRTDSELLLPTTFSGKTLRGQGSSNTIIRPRANLGLSAGSLSSYDNPTSPSILVDGGLAVGANEATLIGDLSSFAVGSMIRFLFQNTTDPLIYSVYGYSEKTNTSPSGQIVIITAIDGQDIEFFPPIAFDRTGQTIKVARQYFNAQGISIEGLTVDMDAYTTEGGAYNAIGLHQCYGGWMIDVKAIKPLHYGVIMTDCLCCEMRDSWAGELKGSGSNGAGLLFNGTCNSVIESNDFVDAFPGIEVNFGATQNVFACNLSNGQANTNHGPHNDGNLHIYNSWNHQLSDGYFGSESRLTLYGCLIWGGNPNLRRFNRYTTVVGCIMQGAIGCGLPFISSGASSGTAQLSLGDAWRDYAMTGVLSNLIDADHFEVTVTSGGWLTYHENDLHRVYFYWGDDLENIAFGDVTAWSDPVATITRLYGTLPVEGTVFGAIGPGSYGGGGDAEASSFPELDLDVEATLVEKGNYRTDTETTSSLGGDTLIDPFYSAKPAFMDEEDAWPPYQNKATATYLEIPAGRRFSEFVPSAAPEITTSPTTPEPEGGYVVGQTVTAVAGTVTGNPPPTRTWQWQVNDGGGWDDIPGATSINYLLPSEYATFQGRVAQIETNDEDPFTDTAYSTPFTILPYMGDVHTLVKDTTPGNYTTMWRRYPLIAGVRQTLEEVVRQTVDTFPPDFELTGDGGVDGYDYVPVNGSGDRWMTCNEGPHLLAAMQEFRDDTDPL